jgi:hypothetical protein
VDIRHQQNGTGHLACQRFNGPAEEIVLKPAFGMAGNNDQIDIFFFHRFHDFIRGLSFLNQFRDLEATGLFGFDRFLGGLSLLCVYNPPPEKEAAGSSLLNGRDYG